MATITASEVNKLRTRTGAGMMDCKKALVEANGDFEAAIDILRKKGQKIAANRSDRDANEGFVYAKVEGNSGVILLVSCETDFVAKNEEFGNFAKSIVDFALSNNVQSVEALNELTLPGDTVKIGDKVVDMMGKIGEKIELTNFSLLTAEKVVAYNHPGNKLATLVAFNKNVDNLDEVARQVAMQIAAMSPVAIDKDGVSQQLIEREMDVAKDLARQEGKPEEMLEKIALGRLNKFFKESTLLNQELIIDNKKTVDQYLKETDKSLTVSDFKRVSLS
jgi:elongation factor Ts